MCEESAWCRGSSSRALEQSRVSVGASRQQEGSMRSVLWDVRIFFCGAVFLAACAKGSDGNDFGANDLNGQSGVVGSADSGQGSTTSFTGPLLNTGDASAPDPDAGKSPVDLSKLVTIDGGLGGYEL